MKIYIVRHGETRANQLKIIQGQKIDEELNSEGVKQADELSQNIDRDFDIIFTSPLKRARQTAQIIANKIKAPVIEKKEIMERDFGSLAGKTWEEIRQEMPSEYVKLKKRSLEQTYDYRPYGGESAEDVKRRFLAFINGLKENYPDKKILILAHKGILDIAHLLFSEEKPEHIKHATVYEFDI